VIHYFIPRLRRSVRVRRSLIFTGILMTWQGSWAAWSQTPPTVPTPPASPTTAPLTLAAATDVAMAQNPTYRAASLQLAQQQAKVEQAQAQRRFQVTFSSTVNGSSADVIQPPPPAETFYTVTNSLNIPIPIGPKPGLAVRQAREQLTAAQAQFVAARLALNAQVNAAYYDVLRKQALLTLAQQALAQAQQQLSAAELRNKAGDVPQLDVLRAQAPVASAQAAVAQAETALAIARQALNDLLGRPLDNPIALVEGPPPPVALPYTLAEVRTLALTKAPEIRAADASIRAGEAAVKSSRLWNSPQLALQASDTHSNDQTGFSRVDAIGVTVTIPLSDGGLGRAQTKEAQAALQQAQAQAEAARRTVLTRVSSAFLTAQSSIAQIESARLARDAAQTIYDKTLVGYQNGLFPFSDVLLSQNALTQARIAYTQALYDAAVALATLKNATGNTQP
jgi:outer membrane protein TolC